MSPSCQRAQTSFTFVCFLTTRFRFLPRLSEVSVTNWTKPAGSERNLNPDHSAWKQQHHQLLFLFPSFRNQRNSQLVRTKGRRTYNQSSHVSYNQHLEITRYQLLRWETTTSTSQAGKQNHAYVCTHEDSSHCIWRNVAAGIINYLPAPLEPINYRGVPRAQSPVCATCPASITELQRRASSPNTVLRTDPTRSPQPS